MKSNVVVWMLIALLGALAPVTDVLAQEQEKKTEGSAENPEESATPEDSEEAEAQRQRLRMRLITRAEYTVGDAAISLNTGKLPVDGPDYPQLASMESGDVVLTTRSQAIKLKTDLPLTFGDLTLETENVAENYAGVYGIWIKKTDDGWSFVFNEKPDVWSTMYDSTADVGEVPVDYAKLDEPNEEMKFEISEADGGHHLRLTWGVHQWTAPFTIAQ
jgi:hypothetical protein